MTDKGSSVNPAGVRVVRGYFVTCADCGQDVAEHGGHGLATLAEAEAERDAHIEQHRAEDAGQ